MRVVIQPTIIYINIKHRDIDKWHTVNKLNKGLNPISQVISIL